MALASLSSRPPLGSKSVSISEGAASAMAPTCASPFPGQGRVEKSSSRSTDNRTARQYGVPVQEGEIRRAALGQSKLVDDDSALVKYDPGFMNTAACRNAPTSIDGAKGIRRY